MINEEQDSNQRQSGQGGTASKTRTTSSRKIEANRRNAQRSTGPKTPEGKAKSSQNSVTHGIFVAKFLKGAAPETVAEIEALATGIGEHYQPLDMLEEIMVQKIVVEAARYDRILGFEHQELARANAFVLSCPDRLVRYTTSTSRELFRAIAELERHQAARKARENSAASTAAESALPIAKTKEERPASQIANTVPYEISTPEAEKK